MDIQRLKEGYAVSVPYRGATFLNIVQIANGQPGNSFRPLSGSYISQNTYQTQKAIYESSFRPLSGSYISQTIPATPCSVWDR